MTLSKSFLWIVVLGFLAIAIWFGVYYRRHNLNGPAQPGGATPAGEVVTNEAARAQLLKSLEAPSPSNSAGDAAARAALIKSLEAPSSNNKPSTAEQEAARAQLLESLKN